MHPKMIAAHGCPCAASVSRYRNRLLLRGRSLRVGFLVAGLGIASLGIASLGVAGLRVAGLGITRGRGCGENAELLREVHAVVEAPHVRDLAILDLADLREVDRHVL